MGPPTRLYSLCGRELPASHDLPPFPSDLRDYVRSGLKDHYFEIASRFSSLGCSGLSDYARELQTLATELAVHEKNPARFLSPMSPDTFVKILKFVEILRKRPDRVLELWNEGDELLKRTLTWMKVVGRGIVTEMARSRMEAAVGLPLAYAHEDIAPYRLVLPHGQALPVNGNYSPAGRDTQSPSLLPERARRSPSLTDESVQTSAALYPRTNPANMTSSSIPGSQAHLAPSRSSGGAAPQRPTGQSEPGLPVWMAAAITSATPSASLLSPRPTPSHSSSANVQSTPDISSMTTIGRSRSQPDNALHQLSGKVLIFPSGAHPLQRDFATNSFSATTTRYVVDKNIVSIVVSDRSAERGPPLDESCELLGLEDPSSVSWRAQIGRLIAGAFFARANSGFSARGQGLEPQWMLKDFPSGYILARRMLPSRHEDPTHVRTALYLDGGSSRFGSASDFAPHAIWLMSGGLEGTCACYCCTKTSPRAPLASLMERAIEFARAGLPFPGLADLGPQTPQCQNPTSTSNKRKRQEGDDVELQIAKKPHATL